MISKSVKIPFILGSTLCFIRLFIPYIKEISLKLFWLLKSFFFKFILLFFLFKISSAFLVCLILLVTQKTTLPFKYLFWFLPLARTLLVKGILKCQGFQCPCFEEQQLGLKAHGNLGGRRRLLWGLTESVL